MPDKTPGPTPAQSAWMSLKYGLFLHFGPNTLAGTGWGDGKFPAEKVDFEKLDCSQWAGMAAEAGMKYAVLTSKHHDGFCLWPSAHTEYSVKRSPSRRDIVGEFADAFRKAGLKVGFYYSLWDRNYPHYEDDERYAGYMQDQIKELLTNYGDILQIWFDGAWDKDFPTREWMYDPAWETNPNSGLKFGERWRWKELYAHIHELQPACLVLNNSSSDRGGQVRYPPVDARTCEHFNFVWRGKLWPGRIDSNYRGTDGAERFLPLEYTTTITPDWFWAQTHAYAHPSGAAIADWRRTAREHRANFLLNLGPNALGLMPEYHRAFLKEAAQLFKN